MSTSPVTSQIQGVTTLTLTGLPPEILERIFMIFLERVDINTVSLLKEMCRKFRAVIEGSPRILKAFEIYKSIKGSEFNIGDLLKNVEAKSSGGEFLLP